MFRTLSSGHCLQMFSHIFCLFVYVIGIPCLLYVSTVTQIVNGQRVTKTETTTRYPDGRVETTTDESTGQIDDGDSRRERLQYW